MKNKYSFGLNIGASSILVIVVILCLVSFAGLSLASSNADYQLSKKLSDRTTAYYNAVSQAYTDIYNKKEFSASENSFDNTYSINENQQLQISVLLNPDSESNYSIDCFKVQTIKEPELDSSLSLLLRN